MSEVEQPLHRQHNGAHSRERRLSGFLGFEPVVHRPRCDLYAHHVVHSYVMCHVML